MRIWVRSLASLSGLRIWHCCGAGHRRGSDPVLLWLWHRSAASALIQPLAQELPYAAGAALKSKKKKKRERERKKWKGRNLNGYCRNTKKKKNLREYHEQLYANKFDNPEEMDNFLETYSPPKLNQEEDQLNSFITRNEIEYVIKTHPINKSLWPDGFTGEFYQTYKELISILKLYPMTEEVTLPKALYEATITPIRTPDKDTTKKENHCN